MGDYLVTTRSIAAGAREEVLQDFEWADLGLVVHILEEFGVFGDQTSGTKWELYAGPDKVAEGAPHYTSYNRDYLAHPDTLVVGRLRLFIKNASGSSQTYTLKVKLTPVG